MHICVAANLEKRPDFQKILDALGTVYEDDPRPYDIALFGDACCSKIQVRLDTGTTAGELTANVSSRESQTTEQVVSAIRSSIEQMLDELETIAG